MTKRMLRALALSMVLAGLSWAGPGPAAPTFRGPPHSVPATVNKAPPKASSVRSVGHGDAYAKHPELGPHLLFVITPPEQRGKAGFILVEAYNYSGTTLNVVDFQLIMASDFGDRIEVHITCDDIRPGLSALKYVKIQSKSKLSPITKAEAKNMQIFNNAAKKVDIKHYFEIVKK